MGPSGHFTHIIVILIFGTGYMQILYLGRAPRTNETLSDFREKYRVTRHSRVFRGLTGSQQTPGFWGITRSIFWVGLSTYHIPFRTHSVVTSICEYKC